MVDNNAYYKKIIYKKNAFEDLKTFVKINYNNKNICLISTKSVPAEDVTSLLNGLFCASEKVSHFVARCGFDNRELEKLNNKLASGEFDLLVSFGGGRCCDVVKYFANCYNLPYIVCPSVASSISYFTSYCINPFLPSESLNAKMPVKIFIQEGIIKGASCYSNINGLCFLHSLRCVYIDGIIKNKENEKYIFVGLEKLFAKLDNEQTNILLCNEDSNLILMDLFIDFGFFINSLNEQNYLLKTYEIYETVKTQTARSFVGKELLLICRVIFSVIKKYIELNLYNIIEMPNYPKISKMIKKTEIFSKKIKNCAYFCEILKNAPIKKEYLTNRQSIYNLVCFQMLQINSFCKKVKSVYKYGIDVEDDFEEVIYCVAISPYLYNGNFLVDYIAGSGILNCFLA